MITLNRHSIQNGIRQFLMVFWLYVALDKLWDFALFHKALQDQPFPDWWADILVWVLPAIELLISFLFVGKPIRKEKQLVRYGYQLSTALLILFTIYIGLGVLGLYKEKPCGCASIFTGVPWAWHLLINLVLITLSIIGIGTINTVLKQHKAYKRQVTLFPSYTTQTALIVLIVSFIRFKMYKRLFAVFPGRPVRR